MLSPAKAIMAGALVLVVGGVMVTAQRSASPPGAAVDDPAMAPSFFSATVEDWALATHPTETRREDGVIDFTGETYTFALDANDPRISGAVTLTMNETDYREAATSLAATGDIGTIRTMLIRIVNDEGSWLGELQHLQFDNVDVAVAAGWLTGTDAYEGLSAYLVWPHALPEVDDTIHGHVTAEGPPPVPDAVPE